MGSDIPSLSGKELRKLLEKAGWEQIRSKKQTGHSCVMKHPGKAELIVIPMHGNKSLKKGLLLRLLKDAGLR